MNALLRNASNSAQPRADLAQAQRPALERLVRRERDFGIGYGRSSGYGCTRRYTSDWAQNRFRCA